MAAVMIWMSNRVVVDSDFRKVIYMSSEKMKGCVLNENFVNA